jgi:hypothetical protein
LGRADRYRRGRDVTGLHDVIDRFAGAKEFAAAAPLTHPKPKP